MKGDRLAALGWEAQIPWEAGMRAAVRWFADNLTWLETAYQRGRDFFEKRCV